MGESLDRRTDIYAASVVLWQALTGRRLFKAENMAAMSLKIIKEDRPPPSRLREGVTRELDAIVLRGMAGPPKERFEDAELMAEAIEKAESLASHREVGQWVKTVAAPRLDRAQTILEAVEAAPLTDIGDDDELGPMSVRQAPSPAMAGAEGLTGANDISFTDITSEASTTGTMAGASRGRGIVVIGAVVAATAVAAVLSFALGRGTATGPASPPSGTSSDAPPSVTTPSAMPSLSASASLESDGGGGGSDAARGASAAPAPSASASATPTASASAAPIVPGPLPKWPPPSDPRLPSGI